RIRRAAGCLWTVLHRQPGDAAQPGMGGCDGVHHRTVRDRRVRTRQKKSRMILAIRNIPERKGRMALTIRSIPEKEKAGWYSPSGPGLAANSRGGISRSGYAYSC